MYVFQVMFTVKFAQRLLFSHGLKINSYTKLLTTLYSKSAQCTAKEIEIPVPWGKVASKLWGSEDEQPILAMHGWQDNAASFDKIAPLIVKRRPVLAIDLPGHGLSSWLPSGCMYNALVYFLLIRRIRNYFGWEKLKIMAHSLSALITYWYAATFPTELQYVIALDIIKFPCIDTKEHAVQFANVINIFFQMEENNIQPSYEENEIMKKRTKGYSNLFESEYRILLSRGATQKQDGTYVFNRDPRVRGMALHSEMFSQSQQEDFARLITCPYLIIKGDLDLYGEKKENFDKTIEILKTSTNDKVHFEILPTTHHLHLTHPEATAAIIRPFLEKYD